MLRKIGVAISYVVTGGYILLIVLPVIYCLRQGCRGPDLDAFMSAFLVTPIGAIATSFSLQNAVQQLRKGQTPWLFWPLAVIFSVILLGVVALVVLVIYHTAVHRR
jgi:hypothetical protein